MIILFVLLGLDIYWHIWEYKERKRLDECWEDLFDSKLNADRRYIDLFKKFMEMNDAGN